MIMSFWVLVCAPFVVCCLGIIFGLLTQHLAWVALQTAGEAEGEAQKAIDAVIELSELYSVTGNQMWYYLACNAGQNCTKAWEKADRAWAWARRLAWGWGR